MSNEAASGYRVRLRHSHALSGTDRQVLQRFLYDAFAGDFDDSDFDHCLGGVHVFAEDDRGMVGHAAVVQRSLVAGDTVLRTGYVEAVAVAARMRRRGVGDAVMARVDDIVVRAHDLGALSASADGRPLYLRRGWEPWRGPLGVLTVDGMRPSPDDDQDSALILRTPSCADLDTGQRLTCDWRNGSDW
ncbi:GNAT family N-acetyltransferase [Gordonia sp. HY002]|uniref:GNAT family N-acetyltransferase n=1 Tax=Gordonia zhenghanii TaxID=2911516 RepID=UPI001EF00299|nr:GNAT family N-acetyltransferase [Gordonia zhenghanii]MCF8570819.1 GNAT family N-acetyltransferase [Gordonia zhenghanii]MCF8605317.1 GNAT family N-acetyltransferase [Gordonia zhenghanii]